MSKKYNFLEVINKLKTCLHVWKSRGLTLVGKILIFKTMALSKILYIATMKVPSKLILDELDLIQKEFIWDSKRPKIKHSILIADYSEGGYKNADIKSKLMSLKLIWIKRLLDDNLHTWKHLSKIFLVPLGGVFLFHSNLSLSDRCLHAFKKLPTFYQELINLFTRTCSTEPKAWLKYQADLYGVIDPSNAKTNQFSSDSFLTEGLIPFLISSQKITSS